MKLPDIILPNPTGLHARPAKVLVTLAKQFKADIRIECNQKRVNAKSMISVLTLGAGCGAVISLEADGEDEELALASLRAAIQDGLGESGPGSAPEAPAGAPAGPEPARPAAEAGVIRGIGAAPGVAFGPVLQYRPEGIDPGHLDAPAAGGLELEPALAQARQQLAELHRRMTLRNLVAEAEIFEAQGEFLADTDFLDAVLERMAAGEPPARAWHAAVHERAGAIAALADPLLAARADDLRDAGRRVLKLLLGLPEQGPELPEQPVVLVARELSPSVTAAFDPRRVLGFVIVGGGPTSHIAILARALGLPAIVGADEAILALPDGTPVILDGNAGTLAVEPAAEASGRAVQAHGLWLEQRRQAQELAGLPAVTLDGRRVDVTGNAGAPANAAEAVRQSADGIGLLRTEFLFLERGVAPGEEEQFEVYRAFAETLKPRPVIIRTMDIGGDKPVAYIHMKPEANPFLGMRGIRLCLQRPDLFRAQLRAILRAASYGNLQIMFPMVSDLGELRQARALLEEERARLDAPRVPLGIMIEVPSAALLADQLAPEVDFFSIGTNDLTQYTLAMDRGHAGLAARQDGLHPAVLRLIHQTVSAAHQHGKRVDLCGELGSDAAAIPILIGLGLDELSVSIPAIATVKAQVRSLSLAAGQVLARQAMACASAAEVRDLVRNAAR